MWVTILMVSSPLPVAFLVVLKDLTPCPPPQMQLVVSTWILSWSFALELQSFHWLCPAVNFPECVPATRLGVAALGRCVLPPPGVARFCDPPVTGSQLTLQVPLEPCFIYFLFIYLSSSLLV